MNERYKYFALTAHEYIYTEKERIEKYRRFHGIFQPT